MTDIASNIESLETPEHTTLYKTSEYKMLIPIQSMSMAFGR
jgi:hypothetical protein